jgi:phosphoadenosine phosphosulfate reductase
MSAASLGITSKMIVKPTKEDLPALSLNMETMRPQEILRWTWDTYGSDLTMATAFGPEGCVLIAMLAQITKDIHIFNLDTGYQFPETLETRERLIERYGIPIHFVRADQSVQDMEAAHGGPIHGTNSDLCCHIRKVVPLAKAVDGYEAWIAAIRRDQTPDRAVSPIIGWDKKFNLVKVNPLANWTKADVWAYIRTHDVPYNPLNDMGYPTVGCWPCTRAVKAGEDERAGRWSGTSKTECGLHSSDATDAAAAGNVRERAIAR